MRSPHSTNQLSPIVSRRSTIGAIQPSRTSASRVRDIYDYNRMVTRVQGYCVENEVSIPRWRRDGEMSTEEELAFQANVLRALYELRFRIPEEDRQDVAEEVARRIVKMGVLQPYLEMDGIEEIIVRKGYVQIEKFGQIRDEGYMPYDDPSLNDEYFGRLARRIADLEGHKLGFEDPKIKVGLPDGSRFTAVISPLSRRGTAINIRRFSRVKMTFQDLVDAGSADEETVDFLSEVAEGQRVSVLFAGRPGAGKTTWLNAFSNALPERSQVSCVETFHELQLGVPHLNHLVVPEGSEAMSDAINTVILRMRPDVLVVGEIVADEAIEYIMALNLGIVSHATIHANSARLSPVRLETLARKSGIPTEEQKAIIGGGLGLIVHLAKDWDPQEKRYKRFLRELVAVKGVSDGQYQFETLKRGDGESFTPLRGGMEIWDHYS